MNDELQIMNEDWVEYRKGKMYQLFGSDMTKIINELNEILVA